jgi:hypothetical protein
MRQEVAMPAPRPRAVWTNLPPGVRVHYDGVTDTLRIAMAWWRASAPAARLVALEGLGNARATGGSGMTDHESAVEIREAITAATDRLEAQLAALVQATERLAVALEREAVLAERITQQAPPAS